MKNSKKQQLIENINNAFAIVNERFEGKVTWLNVFDATEEAWAILEQMPNFSETAYMNCGFNGMAMRFFNLPEPKFGK